MSEITDAIHAAIDGLRAHVDECDARRLLAAWGHTPDEVDRFIANAKREIAEEQNERKRNTHDNGTG